MKMNHFLTICLLLALALVLCTDSGCKKKDTTDETQAVAGNSEESVEQ